MDRRSYSAIWIAAAAWQALARASVMSVARASVTAMRRWPLTLGLPKRRSWVSGSARTSVRLPNCTLLDSPSTRTAQEAEGPC